MAAELFRYAAFLSYSSKDAAFAKRLHGALESFRIPKALGHFDLAGKPNRVYPVFRDREELAAGDLDEELQAALRASSGLIVVCSTNAVASRWVNNEIQYFCSLGRKHRVFAIIAEDEPNDPRSGTPELEFFPAALREGAGEVLSADARKSGDGFRNAWLKVVAGLLCVNAGALQDRDRQQRRRFAAIVSAATAGSLALIAAGIVLSDRANARASFAAHATLLAQSGSRAAALPFALAGLGADNSAAQDVVDTIGGRLPLIAVLDAPRPTEEMQFSPDGKTLATRSGNYEFALWDAATGARRGPLHTAESFWFTGSGETVVLFAESHIEIIEAASGSSIARFEQIWIARDGESAFTAGHIVAAQTGSDTIGVWNAVSGQSIATLRSPNVALPLHLSPSGLRLLSCDDKQRCDLWDVANQRKIAELKSVYGDVAFSSRDDRLAAHTGSGVAMWDASSGDVIQRWSSSGDVMEVIFSADGTRLAISTEGGHGQLLDVRTGSLVADLSPVDNGTDAMQFSAGGSRVTVIGPQATGALWDARSGARIANFSEKDTVTLMQLSPDASRLVIQSFDQKASLWDAQSGRKIADLGSIDKIESATFSNATGPLLLRTLGGASLRTHDAEMLVDFGAHQSHELVSSGSVSEIDIQLSRDGRYLAGLDGDGMVRIWNASEAPISGDGDALRLRICAANGRATPAFRREDRESDDAVARYLKGRPWNVCDWRGFNEPAGWLQTLRYWGTKAGLSTDHLENK